MLASYNFSSFLFFSYSYRLWYPYVFKKVGTGKVKDFFSRRYTYWNVSEKVFFIQKVVTAYTDLCISQLYLNVIELVSWQCFLRVVLYIYKTQNLLWDKDGDIFVTRSCSRRSSTSKNLGFEMLIFMTDPLVFENRSRTFFWYLLTRHLAI